MKIDTHEISKLMYNSAKSIVNVIVDFMVENKLEYIDLQNEHTNGDSIYAFVYNDEYGTYEEVEIVALAHLGKQLHILVQVPSQYTKTIWSLDDIKASWEDGKNDGWYPLFDGDMMSVATAYNLADGLDYIEL